MVEGNASAGRKVFKECRYFHSVKKEKHGSFGPNLYKVVGSKAGSAAEYDYSMALKNSGIIWTVEQLDRWLANPQALLPDSEMVYTLESARDRKDVIAYLIAAGKR